MSSLSQYSSKINKVHVNSRKVVEVRCRDKFDTLDARTSFLN